MTEAPGRLGSPWWPMTMLLAVAVVALGGLGLTFVFSWRYAKRLAGRESSAGDETM